MSTSIIHRGELAIECAPGAMLRLNDLDGAYGYSGPAAPQSFNLRGAMDGFANRLERGVVLNLTASKVIRLAPPINISRELWEQGLDAVVASLTA